MKDLDIYGKMARRAIKRFGETQKKACVWPDDIKWMIFQLVCDSRIAHLKRLEPRGHEENIRNVFHKS